MGVNINNYIDFENITIAEFKAILSHVEKKAIDELARGHYKESAKYGILHIKLNNLLNKKIIYGSNMVMKKSTLNNNFIYFH